MRDPDLPKRLLLAERAALIPILRRTTPADFGRPTACAGWSVRDVLAHCAAVLTRITDGSLHDLSPSANQGDVDARASWTIEQVIDELDGAYAPAGEVIATSGGQLDLIALGEWVHGGDVREALGEPAAYASAGVSEALALLTESDRVRQRPEVRVSLPFRTLALGAPVPGRPLATLEADVSTVIRLYCGRPADPATYRLVGATPDELVIYR
jgi:uncharacterized protein (TIGR03083 family)